MVDRIEFDFEKAGMTGCQIGELTQRMEREVLAEFEEVILQLSEYWRGNAGEDFRRIGEKEILQMKEIARGLQSAGESLDEAVFLAEQQEKRAKEIARLRTY